MNQLDLDKDREENPFFYELVLFNLEENFRKRRTRSFTASDIIIEGKENHDLVSALIVHNGAALDELIRNHVRDTLDFEIMDRAIGDYLRKMDSEGFDGAFLVRGDKISEPVYLYDVIDPYLERDPQVTNADPEAKLDQKLSRFIPEDFVYQDSRNKGFFGNSVHVGKRIGGKTRIAIILPQLYDESLKTYVVKRTVRGRLNTGAVVMFGKEGLERMCYFEPKTYEGGVIVVVKAYAFDSEQGKVIETGRCKFDPDILRPDELPPRMEMGELLDKYA